MENLIELTNLELLEIEGGVLPPYKGSWWCMYCWIDYAYSFSYKEI